MFSWLGFSLTNTRAFNEFTSFARFCTSSAAAETGWFGVSLPSLERGVLIFASEVHTYLSLPYHEGSKHMQCEVFKWNPKQKGVSGWDCQENIMRRLFEKRKSG